MNELPSGWVEAALGEVTAVRKDKQSPSSLRKMVFVGLEEVESNTGRILSTRTTEGLKSAVAVFEPDDVLYGRLRPYLNKVILADFEGAASAEFIVFKPTPCLNQKYLQRVLMSPQFVSFTSLRSTGDRPRVSYEALSDYAFPLPPLREQQRIVEKIEKLFGKSRRAREQLERVPRLVEKYKKTVLAAAFRGDLTANWRLRNGFDARWQDTTVGSTLSDLRYGTAKKCDYDGGSVAVLRIPNIQKGRVIVEDLKYADFDEREIEKLRLALGDILVIRSNGSIDLVGQSAVVNDAAAGMLFAGYLIRLRVNRELVEPEFVHLRLQAPDMRNLVEQTAKSTSGVNNINSEEISNLPISRPSLEEQREIVRSVQKAFLRIDHLATEATNGHKLIDHLDRAILGKAFTGELVPQEPNDEPASALLELMRAGRDQQSPLKGALRKSKPAKAPTKTERKTMGKKRAEVERDHLRKALKELGGSAPARELWKRSDMEIDEFYKQLREEMKAGHISEGTAKDQLVLC
jgi:type I restriction enzyme S subunit